MISSNSPQKDCEAIVDDFIRGYIPFNSGALATTEDDSVATAPDLKESFNIGPLKQISENDVNLKMLRSPNLWPEQPLGLRSHWEQCYKELEDLGSTILHACALALGLPERWFEQHTDGHFSILSSIFLTFVVTLEVNKLRLFVKR